MMKLVLKQLDFLSIACVCMIVIIAAGCSSESSGTAGPTAKPPKPVSTMVLKKTSPSFQHHTTASVAPWKAERIGFEQAGRVVQVIEPNEMVKGGSDQDSAFPLARLDDEQFRIAVASANADAIVAQRRRDSNLVAIQQSLPTQIKTAEAELQLAENELARANRLGNAISRSESDTARTGASTARLRVDSAKAALAQAKADHLALEAQIQLASQRMAEAQRNLNNTVLYSSFPGQVAQVHAVPGTYVKEGDPIVTVTMVDPMLVEFEVTAANSRRYQRGDTLGVTVTTRDGERKQLSGMVYTVDTVADTNTRTFTVALHVRNQMESDMDQAAGSASSAIVARTRNIFPLNIGPIVTGDKRLLVEQSAIHQIAGDDFVWKITNRAMDKLSNSKNRELVVERMKVQRKSDVIPFLGSWNFVAIEFEDPSSVNLEQDLITGELNFGTDSDLSNTNLESWQGNRVLVEQTRWMLRPGDTVRVALIQETSTEGFFVPMKAVRSEAGTAAGETFIHVIAKESESETTAKRITVTVTSEDTVSDESLMLQIESDQLKPGMEIVVGGTHYLNDGDQVRIVAPQRSAGSGR